jgi:hypothetical protein
MSLLVRVVRRVKKAVRMTGYLKNFARFQLRIRIAAALTGVLFAASSCMPGKGTQSAKGAAKGSVESNVQSNENF